MPDSITVDNKGFAISDYFYFNHDEDSAIFRYINYPNEHYIDTIKSPSVIYKGLIYDEHRSVLNNLVKHLKQFPNGMIESRLPQDGTYCGPEFYLEFGDNEGKHLYYFICDNDSIEAFDRMIYELKTKSWEKRLLNHTINSDYEIATSLKNFEWFNKEPSYVPGICYPVIEKQKLQGSWRFISPRSSKTNYYQINLEKDGFYSSKIFENSLPTKDSEGIYIINWKDSTLSIEHNYKKTYKILKLTNTCLELYDINNERKELYEREG